MIHLSSISSSHHIPIQSPFKPLWNPYETLMKPLPIGSMYGIYANIWGILMVKYGIHVTIYIYSIHGSYGLWTPFKPPFEGHRLVGDLRTCGRQPAVIGLLPQRAVAPGHAAVAGLRTALAQRGAPKEPGPVIFSGPNLWMFEVVIFFVDPISECLRLWFFLWTQSLNVWGCDF